MRAEAFITGHARSGIGEHDFCRVMYKNLRLKGAPAIYIKDFAGMWYAESSDGKVSVHDYDRNISCCKWGLKYEMAHRWLEQQPAALNGEGDE